MDIIGHEAIRRELRALAFGADPPHALMFVGPEHTGRSLLALEYAQLLNCEAAAPGMFGAPSADDALPCGQCRPCRLIAEGHHPDVIALGPGDALCKPRSGESGHEAHPNSRDIRICQVRGLIELVARYPFEAKHRAIIIDPADRLGREASHTILKTLEEPPGHSVFCLITSAPEAIVETIRSRCRRIDVPTVPKNEIEAGLVARGVETATAGLAASEARGRPGRAIAFAAQPDLMGDRARMLERCARIAAAGMTERLNYGRDLAERFRADRAAVGLELDTWEAFWEERLRATAPEPDTASRAVEALRAVARAREDLLAQVQTRPALEFMLLCFPAATLEAVPEEEPAGNA